MPARTQGRDTSYRTARSFGRKYFATYPYPDDEYGPRSCKWTPSRARRGSMPDRLKALGRSSLKLQPSLRSRIADLALPILLPSGAPGLATADRLTLKRYYEYGPRHPELRLPKRVANTKLEISHTSST
ncbi:hypothetical protein K525DRAFT_275135 [Schizophyllum commune Loenen D]|nr:hypothetical protein K525DRAFT_275135 [Schizophyllum commune Loenen D]